MQTNVLLGDQTQETSVTSSKNKVKKKQKNSWVFITALIKEHRWPSGHTRDIYNVCTWCLSLRLLTVICLIFVTFPRILHYIHTNGNLGDVFKWAEIEKKKWLRAEKLSQDSGIAWCCTVLEQHLHLFSDFVILLSTQKLEVWRWTCGWKKKKNKSRSFE